ncbi:polygalacturonase QRT3 isoform X2 [Hevea brasiliensis]|uniref:polygalacturonase QRT3 isoform X2 n=1 Tax=Hevea brasiliensis TaxID=3981 RepID=UPI000B784D36|nr:polygalacturonase QRT3 isoform X2 [Hevea brasiliensis]
MGMEPRMQTNNVLFCFLIIFLIHVHGEQSPLDDHGNHFHDQMRKMQAFKSSLIRRELVSCPSPSPSPSPSFSAPAPSPQAVVMNNPRVFEATSFGADPSGKLDSTEALEKAIAAAFQGPKELFLMNGITNLGGAHIHLQGGIYKISQPLRLPTVGAGNLMIGGGTLLASDDFPTDGGGGISVINSLRTSIDNCYITHFNTNGILVQQGHETYIRNSFLGQHITAGSDPGERKFSGIAINLMGNDNAVTDVVIFSAAIGIMVSGQANTLSGVHCYNKATSFGGTGIYLKLPNLTQTRILNCYLDYTRIIAEDPNQLTITNSFFLGDAYIVLKSVKGIAKRITIVDNMFSGSNKGIDIVQLEQSSVPFKEIDQVVVDRNNVQGMNIRATNARKSVQGNGTSWSVDFSPILLFPDLINHVQYSLRVNGNSFPNFALRNVSENKVVIESNIAVTARVFVMVNQAQL